MRKLINYICSCFCKHEWEMIFDVDVERDSLLWGSYKTYSEKTYRCKKCGCIQKVKSS